MKNCTYLLPTFLLGLGLCPLPAQPVVFTNHTSLLNPPAGFANYADCTVDMNGDYLDDVVRIFGKSILIDYQQPGGSFIQQIFNMPIQAPPSWSICAGDLDNNGFNDLLFAHTFRVSFVKANATGTAYVETVMPVPIFSQRSTLADIDNDGWLDAFVCHDTDQSIPFHNDGAGNMKPDTNLIHTADRPGSYSAIWTDYDNDGDIDLYITKCKANAPPSDPDRINLLYRNNGDGTFTEVGAQAGLDDNAQSWSTVFEDFDNDGDFDAFIVNHDFQNRLFRNNGNGTFTDVIAASGIDANDLGAFENSSGDFNNDGFLDIFSELHHHLYLGHGDLTFTGQDLPFIPGGIADLNNDGFLDVTTGNQLWINTPNANHWLRVNLWGTAGNRNGIGARVEIYGSWGRQIRELRSGQSYSPMSTLTLHFGLGEASQVDSMLVKWPSGIVTRLSPLSADTTYLIPEAPCLLPSSSLVVNGPATLCPGDSTELVAPTGFADYRWSNGAITSTTMVGQAGHYAVLLTDAAGCISTTDFVTINQVTEVVPVITASGSNYFCAGDTLFLTASFGENYTWSNGSTGTSGIAVTQTGNYTVAVDALCSDQPLLSEPYAVSVVSTPLPVAAGAAGAPGDSLLLTATGDHLYWYDQPAGGSLLDTGATFRTPSLDSAMTFYVENHAVFPATMQTGGKPDTTGAGGIGTQVGYELLEAWQPFTLLSVTVYLPPNAPAGSRFIQLFLRDSLLASQQFTLQSGFNVLPLNFAVPVGKLSLRCPQGSLFRNVGQLAYPYALGSVGRITTSSAGDQFYYYFYDWKIETTGFECASERVPVAVTVTGTQTAFAQNDWQLFPNPASGQVFLTTDLRGDRFIRLFDASGREVRRQIFPEQPTSMLDLSGLVPGLYTVQLWQAGQFVYKKLMVH